MGVLELVVFLAVVGVATGLNADGVALLAFKGSIWSDPKGVFKTWNTSDATPCLWKGITCVRIQATMEDRVVSLDLSRKKLSGTIGPSLGLLGHLAAVNLSNNKFTGQIPRELFRVTSLSRLYLSYNNLTGGIPVEIRNLGSQLRVLEISGNRLSELPQEIVACYRLRRLVLSNNRIKGVIPVGIGAKLKQLERLDLSVNEFVGSVPDDFGNLSSLLPQAPLNLSNNYLSGSIPPSLANLRSVPIDLSNNQLSGPIPSNSYFQSQGPVAYVGNAALCGSPLKIDCTPSPSPSSVLNSSTPGESGRNFKQKEEPPLSKAAVVAISVGSGIAGFMLMASFVLYFLMSVRNSRLQRADSASRYLCSWRSGAPETGYDDDDGDLVHLSGVFSFNLEQLLRAAAYVLGKSDVGIVYKAVLDEGSVVAVRRLGEGGELKRKEFECEVKSIAQVHHPNVVSLHSYSWTPEEKLLVYDYLPNGSLETALHGGSESSSKGTLPWAARVRIASGTAHGLAHVHERKQTHGDIRPANILLDGFLEPRIAGLGVRRLVALMAQAELSVSVAAGDKGRGDSGRSASSVSPAPEFQTWSSISSYDVPFSTGPMYQAPEVSILKRASPKSDVYSFGLLLLELVSRRSPFQLADSGKLDLVSWLRFALQQKNVLFEIFDPELLVNVDDNLQTKMIETLQVALACTTVNPDSRPKMKQVAEFFKEIQTTS